MGVTIGQNTYHLSCDYCTNETEKYHDYDILMSYAISLGWLKNYITGNCTCPECRKKSNESMK